MENVGATSANPHYRLYHKNTLVLSKSNGKAANGIATRNAIVNAKADATFYTQMYRGISHATYYITYFELVD